MVILAHWILSLVALLGTQAVHGQHIQAQFNHSSIAENESVTLALTPRHVGISVGSVRPDLSPLQTDFDVLRTSSKTVGGKKHSVSHFFVELAPKRSGRLNIEPLTWGRFRANSLSLDVRDTNAMRAATEPLDMFIETELRPRNAFVQQELLYIVRVVSARGSAQGTITQPAPLNTEVYPLIDKRPYTEVRDSRRLSIREWRFVMFPQKSGALRVPPVIFGGSTHRPGNGIAESGHSVTLTTDEFDIVVAGKPANFTGATWLPAKTLRIHESLAQTATYLKVGDPVTRTIRIDARGLTGNQLPEMIMPIVDGLKQYPDQAATKTTSTRDGVNGTREQSFSLMPTRPGVYELPEIRLPWWDTIAKQERVAIVAARALIVSGESGFNAKSDDLIATSGESQDTESAATTLASARSVHLWQVVSASLLVLWLATALGWWRASSTKHPENHVQESGDAKKAHQARKRFLNACANGDPKRARSTLSNWLSRVLNANADQCGLITMATRLNDAALLEEVMRLDATLYAAATDTTWDPQSLVRKSESAVAAFTANRDPSNARYDLEPLYPPHRSVV